LGGRFYAIDSRYSWLRGLERAQSPPPYAPERLYRHRFVGRLVSNVLLVVGQGAGQLAGSLMRRAMVVANCGSNISV
jgi:hypothetical protein